MVFFLLPCWDLLWPLGNLSQFQISRLNESTWRLLASTSGDNSFLFRPLFNLLVIPSALAKSHSYSFYTFLIFYFSLYLLNTFTLFSLISYTLISIHFAAFFPSFFVFISFLSVNFFLSFLSKFFSSFLVFKMFSFFSIF